MSDTLTLDTIKAAQGSDLSATSAVIEATESRVIKLADKAARRMASNPDRVAEYREEFAQVARIAVWESLSRFDGDSVDSFYGFIYSTVEARLLDAVREERNGATGADSDAVKVFAQMLTLADGDVYLAEKMAQTVPPKGRRLGADRANAARMAWQGAASLDIPVDRGALGYGQGAIYTTIADNLPSALGLPEDLITSADITAEISRAKHALVNAILDVMGQGQRDVIRHSFGIGGVEDFGYGREDNRDAELAAFLGTAVGNLRPARSKGLKAFAKRYVKAVAASEEHAAELTEAAAKNLSRSA
jgi:RNA polymerase sigma factor (sigma-70 family)